VAPLGLARVLLLVCRTQSSAKLATQQVHPATSLAMNPNVTVQRVWNTPICRLGSVQSMGQGIQRPDTQEAT
jgi:hypothetical protein